LCCCIICSSIYVSILSQVFVCVVQDIDATSAGYRTHPNKFLSGQIRSRRAWSNRNGQLLISTEQPPTNKDVYRKQQTVRSWLRRFPLPVFRSLFLLTTIDRLTCITDVWNVKLTVVCCVHTNQKKKWKLVFIHSISESWNVIFRYCLVNWCLYWYKIVT
jgi:hypothetical protein